MAFGCLDMNVSVGITPPFVVILSNIIFIKISSIFEQHKSLIIYISYFVVLECCNSNYLIPISALYGFWLLSYKHFCRYTPTLFCDFYLILKVVIKI